MIIGWRRLAAVLVAGAALAGCEKKTPAVGTYDGGKAAGGNPALAAKFIADGEAALRSGDTEAAVRNFHHATDADPRSFSAWYRLQEALHIAGNDADCRQEFARRLAAAPEDPLWLTLNAVTDPGGREARLREAIKKAPEFAWAHFVLSETLVMLKRYDDAVVSADRALQLDPKNGVFRLRKADSLMWAGKLDDALAEADKAKEALPGDERVPIVRAQILMVLDRVDEAIAAMQEAGRLAPAAKGTQALLRDWRTKAASTALKEYDDAFKAGRLGSAADAAQKAAGYLDAILTDTPDDIFALRNLPQAETAAAAAHLQRAVDALRDGKEDDAAGFAERAKPWLEKAKGRKLDEGGRQFVAQGWMRLGLVDLSLGEKESGRGSAGAKDRFKAALEAFQSCLRIDPENKSAPGLAEEAKKAMEKK
ncbi:MAG: hypothetical protein K8T20_12760 [Planctomycetes bacterium]|nr:hypothetical protein [Planctomycetota bacterium]